MKGRKKEEGKREGGREQRRKEAYTMPNRSTMGKNESNIRGNRECLEVGDC